MRHYLARRRKALLAAASAGIAAAIAAYPVEGVEWLVIAGAVLAAGAGVERIRNADPDGNDQVDELLARGGVVTTPRRLTAEDAETVRRAAGAHRRPAGSLPASSADAEWLCDLHGYRRGVQCCTYAVPYIPLQTPRPPAGTDRT